MSSIPTLSDARLFAQFQKAFGLNQTSLGRLLGLSRAMMSEVRRGQRPFPMSAAEPYARLLALDKLPATLPPPAAPDAALLRLQQQTCRARAMRLALELTAMKDRAQCAAYLAQKQPERAALLAQQTIIQVQINNWDLKGNPETELATTAASIATLTPLAAAMAAGTNKHRIENMIILVAK
jgi:transcriptional regulator with XRE-family HTH domain